jgi:hypothetical protein
MITADCDSLRDGLDAYVDGELRGAELLHVTQHLDGCQWCRDEVEARQRVGASIRAAVRDEVRAVEFSGLASGVVARVRAEFALSWRAMFDRAVEDWHWVIVGGGSVAATFVSTLVCSALLLFGPAPERSDSLSALVNNLGASPGSMYAEVTRPGAGRMMLVEIDTGSGQMENSAPPFAADGAERAWVGALGEALAGGGPLVQLASMSEGERRYTESLLDNISRSQMRDPGFGGVLEVHRLRLVTSTGVTAKGLRP